jgi:hypothetical protein
MDRIKTGVDDHSCVYPVRLSLNVSPSVKTCYVQEVKEEQRGARRRNRGGRVAAVVLRPLLALVRVNWTSDRDPQSLQVHSDKPPTKTSTVVSFEPAEDYRSFYCSTAYLR